jgi:hypothetical protein
MITLKKIKYFEAGSKETPCFTADLYDNGKLVAHISNDGWGGNNMIHPAKGLEYKDVIKYDDIDTEAEIFEMVYLDDVIRKNQNKGLLFKEQGEIRIIRFKKSIAQLKRTPMGVKAIEREVNLLKEEGLTVINRNL